MRITVKGLCLMLLLGGGAGAVVQRSTLMENFGVGKERTLVGSDGAYFASDPANADEKRRFVLGFDAAAESKRVRLIVRRAKGRNHDNNQEATYFTVSSCVLDDKLKCGKLSAPIPLRAVEVEIGKGQEPTATVVVSFSGPLNYGASPYYEVYSPTFSPRLLIKVSSEQQQKALRSLLQ